MGKQGPVRMIEVVPYDPRWQKEYIEESRKIRDILNCEIVEIHHIGSTAIPGIYAKPIIDILIVVKDIENIDKYNEKMHGLGYISKGEFGIEGRRFFLKGLYDRTHHMHIFETGNPEIIRHLNFRDYMISHPETAKDYEKLKRGLSVKFRYDNEGYCKGKDEYIKDIDQRAKAWFESNSSSK